ncbi:hypothetical protein N8311_01385 [bacterium]|nr:hypothetical protein [bacterium]
MIYIVKLFLTINLLIYPSFAISDNLGNVANKLFNAYEYDDKINRYLKSFFSFKVSKERTSNKIKKNIKNNHQISKHSLKIKSNKKIIYNFGNGQSLQMNPSNIDNKIIYNWTPNSYFEIKNDSLLYGIKLDF